MSQATPVSYRIVSTNLPERSEISPTGSLLIYPSELKRVVVKATSRRRLENQILHIETNTFTTINRNYEELFQDIDFVEL